jgi:hypothetical protein
MKLRNSNLPAAEGQPVANKARLTAQHLHQHWHRQGFFSPAEPDDGFCLSSGKAERESVKSCLS